MFFREEDKSSPNVTAFKTHLLKIKYDICLALDSGKEILHEGTNM